MQKDFYILGTFVNSATERETEEDLTPLIFKKFISTLNEGDELTLHVNSCGGDVNSGISIANMIQALNDKGVMTTAIVDGIAASIASVVVCACKKIKMYESSFLMIHKCWSVVQGNSDELRKEADVMDKINKAIIQFYHKKFDLTDEELENYMNAETWICGNEINNYKFNAEIISEQHQYKIAASIKDKKFNNIPKDLIMEKEEVKAEVEETKAEEQPIEEKKDEVKTEVEEKKDEVVVEVKDTIETVTKAECDKRVSGMQSSMQAQINTQKKDYECKIADFMNQLKAKDEELISVKNEITNLQKKLEDSAKELQTTASALAEKTDALAQLNADVNTPNEALPSFKDGLAKCNSLKERMDFISSGKYKRN